MERYSRKDAEACFGRLCDALGKAKGTWDEVGSWSLDYNGVYGGYIVTEVVTAGGGLTHPLGERRRSAREFCEAVWFALRVLEQAS